MWHSGYHPSSGNKSSTVKIKDKFWFAVLEIQFLISYYYCFFIWQRTSSMSKTSFVFALSSLFHWVMSDTAVRLVILNFFLSLPKKDNWKPKQEPNISLINVTYWIELVIDNLLELWNNEPGLMSMQPFLVPTRHLFSQCACTDTLGVNVKEKRRIGEIIKL